MRAPGLLEGVLVAAAASVLAAAGWLSLSLVLPGPYPARVVISMLALGYLVYLLARSSARAGRSAVIGLWSIVVAAGAVLDLGLGPYLLVHLGLLWLVRSLYFYSSVLSALLDLALGGLSLAIAAWAAAQTGSVFMTTWCLFLTQALFCLIPGRLPTERRATPAPPPGDDFERAYRSAEAALEKLSVTR